MQSTLELINNIKQNLAKDHLVIVAIDGRGGSGKSTLAKKIQAKFAAQLICTDDYFDFQNMSESDYFWDKSSFQKDILTPLVQKREALYHKNILIDGKFTGKKEVISIQPKGLVIIEGLLSLHRDLLKYYDQTVWVDLSLEESLTRAKSRDIMKKGWDKNMVDDNWAKWLPVQEKYIELEKPQENAKIVFKVNIQ
jgi:uridine kinase